MADEIRVRSGGPGDAAQVVALLQELAASANERSPVTEEFVARYLAAPGSHILLAEEAGQVAGLLSYGVRPNLYHAGNTALIEELVVTAGVRGQGVGGALMAALFQRLEQDECVEVSVSTMADNHGAIRFYRAHGLVDQAVLLERHFRGD